MESFCTHILLWKKNSTMKSIAHGNVIFFPFRNQYCAFSPSNTQIMSVPDISKSTVEKAVQLLKPSLPEVPTKFRALTLFLTTNCNMRCLYCYGRGGDRNVTLDWKTIRIYLDFYLSTRPKYPTISFHGGGEPSLEIDLVRQTVAYIIKRGIPIEYGTFAIGTNGVMDPEFLNYLIENKFAFSISYDGLPEIQQHQRPIVKEVDGFTSTEETINQVANSGNPYCISCTVTDYSVNKMSNIVRHIKKIGGSNLWFHTAFPAGRCKLNDKMLPVYDLFFQNMRKAEQVALEENIKLGRSDPFCSFTIKCAMSTLATIAVSSDGYITGCLEVCTKNDEFAETFILGGISNGKVQIYEAKVRIFRERSPEVIRRCRSCYIRPICAGSCPIHCLRVNGDINTQDDYWCRYKRKETLYMLQKIAEASL